MAYLEKPITASSASGSFTAVAICDRCGQALAHPCFHNDMVYGFDCYEVVTGQRARWQDYLTPDQKEKNRRKQIERAERTEANMKAYAERCAAFASFNANLIPDVITELQNRTNSDFCQSIAKSLSSGQDMLGTLPNRAYYIVADIFAKSQQIFRGKGSREKNKIAYETTLDRLGEIAALGLDYNS